MLTLVSKRALHQCIYKRKRTGQQIREKYNNIWLTHIYNNFYLDMICMKHFNVPAAKVMEGMRSLRHREHQFVRDVLVAVGQFSTERQHAARIEVENRQNHHPHIAHLLIIFSPSPENVSPLGSAAALRADEQSKSK